MSAAVIDLDAERKTWSTLVARACLRGYQLWRTDAADGEVRYFVGRWGMIHAMANAADVDAWLERAGAA